MRYPLVFYTKTFLPEHAAGCARGPVIIIDPDKRGDEGLYQHELEHVKQAALTLFIRHALLYLFWRAYRQWAEVNAYAVQTKYPNKHGVNMSLELGAWRLCLPQYDLNLSLTAAVDALIEAGA